MVEAAGVEPASENDPLQEPTCLAHSFLPRRPAPPQEDVTSLLMNAQEQRPASPVFSFPGAGVPGTYPAKSTLHTHARAHGVKRAA